MMFGNNPGTDETWKLIPEGSTGVELGVWKGDSSEKFLRRAKHVHLVDAWAPEAYENSTEFGDYDSYLERYSALTGSNKPEDFKKYYDRIYEGVVNRFTDKPVTIHRTTTKDFFDAWDYQNDLVDWVYVDASHEFEGCLRDLVASMLIVKPGGFIFGDDFGDAKPGVRDAVDYFLRASMFEFNNFYEDQYYFVVDDQNFEEILKECDGI